MARFDAQPVVEHDASAGFGAIRGVHETNIRRTLALEIRRQDDGFRLYVQTDDPVLQDRLGEHLEDELKLDETTLAGAVRDCRQSWHRALIHREWGGLQVHYTDWDFGRFPGYLDDAMPELALAGARLWRAIFFPRDPDRERFRSLRHIGKVLRNELDQEGRWLRISSEGFYVPWALVYAGDLDTDGSNWQRSGFWGYQHLIEHAPLAKGNLGNELQVATGGPLVVGLQLDDTIDQDLGVECIKPVDDLLASQPDGSVSTPRRVTRKEWAEALRKGPLDEQILFFCCHAEQDGVEQFRFDQAYLRLTDRTKSIDKRSERIIPADIEDWIDLRDFYEDGHRPLVFLNACGSGQLNSMFYPSFGETFLALGACSVIGAQVELPAPFAGEFARRFFERFLEGSGPGVFPPENTIGQILYDLRREFIDLHNNPLGLIYSVFRGADVHIRRW